MNIEELKLELKYTSRRGSLCYSVKDHNTLAVKAPHGTSMDYIREDISRNWDKVHKLFESYYLDFPVCGFADGMKLFLMDTEIILRYKTMDGIAFHFNPDENTLYVAKDLQNEVESLLKCFFSHKAEYLRVRCRYLAMQHNFRINRINLRWVSSKWGSCSVKGNVTLSNYLIMAPKAIQDYIILHELCHLRHMNHSKDFYTLLQKLDAQYKEHRAWLKDKGRALRIFHQK
ncbi:MAG TPA: hypothetical protein DG355_04105 [Candidatus Cloacimonas sp.]|nr:hypothetical protein [Candidatus Cloacimonas sp.]